MNNMKLIMEGWRTYQSTDFDFLCESYRRRIITEERLIQLWERNAELEYQDLLEENIMDVLSVGYEKGKQLAGKAKAAYDTAVEKLSNFFLKLSMQALSLVDVIQSAARKAKSFGNNGTDRIASILNKIYRRVDAYCEKHPVICKVTKILIAMITIVAAMALFSGAAEAAVQVTSPSSGDPIILNDKGINALKAILQLGNEGKDPEVQQVYADAFQWMEKAHASETLHDVSKETGLGPKYVQTAMDLLGDILKDDPSTSIQGFANYGEKVVVKSHEFTQEIYASGKGTERTHITWQSLAAP
ncbi:MAG: hypothetical protein CMP98_15730 [Gammaproteobacteria bacterium]|nr:hypothetical protein [Gammaproteobacteria bacterium]